MKDIVIVGNGGFAKEVAFLIDDINRSTKLWNVLGFVGENEHDVGKPNGRYTIIQSDSWLLNHKQELHVVIGIGNPAILSKIAAQMKTNPYLKFPNLIHPTVVGDWERIVLGAGNIICAGNILTTDIQIGSFNIFNLSCTTGHDCIIGNYNVFNPSVNISGGIILQDRVLLGTGSQVLQYLKICSNAIIGAGAVVVKDITTAGTYVGVPAKPLPQKD